MSPHDRELYRSALLRVLEANDTRWGLSIVALEVNIAAFGFRHSGVDQVDREMRYLQGKGFVATVGKQISPENQAWQITAAGRDWLATNG